MDRDSIFIAPDMTAIRLGFDYALDGIEFPNDPQAKDRFRADFRAGGAWAKSDGWDECCIDHLQGKDWQWPWLEQWKERFARLGELPRMWTRGRTESFHSAVGRRVPIDRDVFLFSHTVMTTIRNAFRKRDAYNTHVRFSRVADEPAEIARIEKLMIDNYRTGRSSMLPPFYPGSRVSVRFISADLAARHIAEGDGELIARNRSGIREP